MNEKLRFSWGHILAFLALIFIAYVTFMGITYLTLGKFLRAGIGAGACVILLAVCFLGAQIKKGSHNKNFYKSMKWERFFLFISPLVLLLVFIPYNHFWSVLHQEDDIARNFKHSIESARGIFDEYENTAYRRINVLSNSLSNASKEERISIEGRHNRIDALTLLLLSKNYDHLKTEANSWIDTASKGATVWNVFLLGNVEDIARAVDKWTKDLESVSSKYLSFEEYGVSCFNSKDCAAKNEAIKGLTDLQSIYSSTKFKFNFWALVTMAICFLMLLCPYFIQERHAANCERLWDFGLFSRFFDVGENNRSKRESQPKPILSFRKKSSSKANIENINKEIKEKNNPIQTPKSSKGAPI